MILNNVREALDAVTNYLTDNKYTIRNIRPLNHERHFLLDTLLNEWAYKFYLKYDRTPYLKPWDKIPDFPHEEGQTLDKYWFKVAKAQHCVILFANPLAVYKISWQQFEQHSKWTITAKGEDILVIPVSKLEQLFILSEVLQQ